MSDEFMEHLDDEHIADALDAMTFALSERAQLELAAIALAEVYASLDIIDKVLDGIREQVRRDG